MIIVLCFMLALVDDLGTYFQFQVASQLDIGTNIQYCYAKYMKSESASSMPLNQEPDLTKVDFQSQSASKKTNKLVPAVFIFLILIMVIITMFLMNQNRQLQHQVSNLKTSQDTTPTPTEIKPTTTPIPINTVDSTSDWQRFDDSNAGFSISYPPAWRTQKLQNSVGFGPQEIQEDTAWGVQFFNKNEKSRQSIISEIGKQFPDRKQAEELVSINGLSGIKVITTTNQYKNWYSEVVILETENSRYAIANGAQTDADFNASLFERTGNKHQLKFEDFYNSFTSHEFSSNGSLVNHYLGVKLTYPENWTIIDNYKDPATSYVASIGTPPHKEFRHETDAFLSVQELSDTESMPTLTTMAEGRGEYVGANDSREITMGDVPGIMIYYSDNSGDYQEFIFQSGSKYVGISSPRNTTHQETITEILTSLKPITKLNS